MPAGGEWQGLEYIYAQLKLKKDVQDVIFTLTEIFRGWWETPHLAKIQKMGL